MTRSAAHTARHLDKLGLALFALALGACSKHEAPPAPGAVEKASPSAAAPAAEPASGPLRIAYSDWPG
ncbi:MAG TPA: hypothetical protein VI299_04105, partial [Polyangiales bacterium]